MVGVIDGFRWCLLRGNLGAVQAAQKGATETAQRVAETGLWWPSVLTSVTITFILCASGLWYFRKMERRFADVI